MADDLEKGQKRKTNEDYERSLKQAKQTGKKFWENVLNDEKLVEMIFQHLTFGDLIKAGVVAKLWEEAVGKSRKCMEKFQINVGKDEKNVENLKNSGRKYLNLKLHSFSENVVEYLEKHTWSKANILIGSMTDNDFLRLLKIFAPEITEFEFYLERVEGQGNYVENSEENSLANSVENSVQNSKENFLENSVKTLSVVNFPKLKSLIIRWTDPKVFEPFFGENENLENVEIELKQQGLHKNVKKLLCKNKSIKSLALRMCHEDFLDFFSEDFSSQHQLQMEILSFYWKDTLFVERKVIENVEKFFLSQRHCLQRLIYEATFNTKSILELIINEMTQLKHLTFVDLDPVLTQEGDYNFQPNHSIHQLSVCANWFVFDKVFEELIKATKNLEVLYIIELTLDTMKFLAENAKNLRHLIYEEIEEDCEEYYNNLILGSDGDDVVNSMIQISWEQDFEIDYPEIHSTLHFN